MSSEKTGEKPVRRKPKVSWGRLIRPGLVGALAEAERRRCTQDRSAHLVDVVNHFRVQI